MKTTRRLILMLAVLLPLSVHAKNFKLTSSAQYQKMNFAANAYGTKILASLDEERRWGVHGGFNYINKFNDSAPGYTLGGLWWPSKETSLSVDVDLAPGQSVVPQQAYTFGINRILFKILVPEVSYRFSDYKSVNNHMVMPGATWYFFPRFDLYAKYFLSVSQFGGSNHVNHSMMSRISWNFVDPVTVSAGYARSNESFESGNPIAPLGSFSANHFLARLKWEIYKSAGIDFNFDYERRNNGFTLQTYDLGLFYLW